MNIIIHRGTHQIGGCATEYRTKNTRIFIDFGAELDSKNARPFDIEGITKGKTNFANLNELFPNYINNSLKEAIPYFENKIKGFSNPDSLLLGIEARTSIPIKMFRENYESNIKGIYPTGEGAGYAGGITTAAIDGIKQAENYVSIYRP